MGIALYIKRLINGYSKLGCIIYSIYILGLCPLSALKRRAVLFPIKQKLKVTYFGNLDAKMLVVVLRQVQRLPELC